MRVLSQELRAKNPNILRNLKIFRARSKLVNLSIFADFMPADSIERNVYTSVIVRAANHITRIVFQFMLI